MVWSCKHLQWQRQTVWVNWSGQSLPYLSASAFETQTKRKQSFMKWKVFLHKNPSPTFVLLFCILQKRFGDPVGAADRAPRAVTLNLKLRWLILLFFLKLGWTGTVPIRCPSQINQCCCHWGLTWTKSRKSWSDTVYSDGDCSSSLAAHCSRMKITWWIETCYSPLVLKRETYKYW